MLRLLSGAYLPNILLAEESARYFVCILMRLFPFLLLVDSGPKSLIRQRFAKMFSSCLELSSGLYHLQTRSFQFQQRPAYQLFPPWSVSLLTYLGSQCHRQGYLFYLRGVFLLCLVFSSVAYFKLGLCGLIYLSVVCSDSTCNQFQTQRKALVSLLSISGVGMNFLLICRNSMAQPRSGVCCCC